MFCQIKTGHKTKAIPRKHLRKRAVRVDRKVREVQSYQTGNYKVDGADDC